jgi:hypothetical protein
MRIFFIGKKKSVPIYKQEIFTFEMTTTISATTVKTQNKELVERIQNYAASLQVGQRKSEYTENRYVYLWFVSVFFKVLYVIILCLFIASLLSVPGAGGAGSGGIFASTIVKTLIVIYFVAHPFLFSVWEWIYDSLKDYLLALSRLIN